MNIGTVSQVWRYPVKSMAGERVPNITLDALGAIGDRCWTMLEKDSGDIAWGKSAPKLMNLSARYIEEPPIERVYGPSVPPVTIEFPDGDLHENADDIDAAVSEYVGRPLRIHPLESPDNLDHYRWQTPVDEAGIKRILGMRADEPLPDMSVYPPELLGMLSEFFAPPGSYNDMSPLHVVTTAAMEHMSRKTGENFDVKRFRPNFVIETASSFTGIPEFDWVGSQIKVGGVVLRVDAKTVRCSMPARGQALNGLMQSAGVAKGLATMTGRFFGISLSVVTAGVVNENDPVELIS